MVVVVVLIFVVSFGICKTDHKCEYQKPKSKSSLVLVVVFGWVVCMYTSKGTTTAEVEQGCGMGVTTAEVEQGCDINGTGSGRY